jgi:hypothetical protein
LAKTAGTAEKGVVLRSYLVGQIDLVDRIDQEV